MSVSANDVDSLMNAFDAVPFESKREGFLRELGEDVHKFITDKRNKKILETAKGRELLIRQKKLAHYFVIKKKLESCGGTGSDRQLSDRVIEAAGNSEILSIDCANPFQEFTSLQGYIGSFRQQFDLQTKSQLQTNVFEQALKNSASTYLNFKLQYGDWTQKPNPKIVLDLCKDASGKSVCDPKTKGFLLAHADNYIRNFDPANKQTTGQAASTINGKIAELNLALEGVAVPRDQGWFSRWVWSSPEITESSRESFHKTYVSKYLTVASSGSGVLMLTDSMKSKIGGLREISDDIKEERHFGDHGGKTKRFTFSPHQRVDTDDVSRAIKEAEEIIKKQVSNLTEMENTHQRQLRGDNILPWVNLHTLRNKDLKRLLRVNPQTFGQVLISNPEYASIVCSMIDIISESDESDAKWRTAYLWGGFVVGGVLMVAGGLAGGLVLANVATAATTVSALSTVGMVSSVAGIGVGLADGGLNLARAQEARILQAELEMAVITGNSDKKGIQEARRALTEFNEAKLHAILSLGLTPLDVAALYGAVKAGQMGIKIAQAGSSADHVKAVESVAKVLKSFSEDPRLVSNFRHAKEIEGEGASRFVGYLGQASEKTVDELMKRAKSMTPEQFQKMVKDGLEGIRTNKCGK